MMALELDAGHWFFWFVDLKVIWHTTDTAESTLLLCGPGLLQMNLSHGTHALSEDSEVSSIHDRTNMVECFALQLSLR